MMAEETKVTLKVGVIAAGVATFLIFMLNTIWGHETRITTLSTNQASVMLRMEKVECAIDKIPQELAAINTHLFYLTERQKVHSKVSKENNILLKRNGDTK
jgi:uncharacterized membrane protein